MEEKNTMNIYEKLLNIQNELKAPKNQFNKFGNYKYRNAEDILEAVKPICLKYKAVINVRDTIIQIGDRYYVEATAYITDVEKPAEYIENKASAREEENKKGMDSSQVTGATSSYARKYALNGLLCIDDTKDTDSEEYQKQVQKNNKGTTPYDFEKKEVLMIQESQKQQIRTEIDEANIKNYLKEKGKSKLSELTFKEAYELLKKDDKEKEEVF